MRYRLVPFPSAAAPPVAAVEADVRREGDHLHFAFRVSRGAKLKTAPRATPARRDGLWRSTCFEAFIKPGAGDAYFEFNFSPSGDWAAYRFDRYRRGMMNAAVMAPDIQWRTLDGAAELAARIDATALGLSPSARLGLSAILETKQHEKTYWALAHPGDKPDFHHAGGFIARPPHKG